MLAGMLIGVGDGGGGVLLDTVVGIHSGVFGSLVAELLCMLGVEILGMSDGVGNLLANLSGLPRDDRMRGIGVLGDVGLSGGCACNDVADVDWVGTARARQMSIQ